MARQQKYLMKAFLCVLLALLVGPVHADQLNGRYHVKSLFSENAQAAGVFVQEGFPGCLYDLMYIDLGTTAGKAQLALLTSAKMGGWVVTRLDFTRTSNGACWLYGVHVE